MTTPELAVQTLDKSYAREHNAALVALTREIPRTEYYLDDITAEVKRGSPLEDKWQLSRVAILPDQTPAGFMLAYRTDSGLYVDTLAVQRNYQRRGIGRALLQDLVAQSEPISLQTNSAAWNMGVINFYRKLGFAMTDQRVQYHNRVDAVMVRPASS